MDADSIFQSILDLELENDECVKARKKYCIAGLFDLSFFDVNSHANYLLLRRLKTAALYQQLHPPNQRWY